MAFKRIAVLLFGGVADMTASAFSFVKQNLVYANVRIPFRTYMSMVFFFAFVGFLSTLVILNLVLFFLNVSVGPILFIAYSIFVPIVVGLVIMFMLAFYPYQKVSSRRKSIEVNLPFALNHMGAVAESGVPPYVIFKLISEFDEYGEISNEMKKIVRNIEIFGMDPVTAVKQVSSRTPNEQFKQILEGITTTIESGGDIKLYLKNVGEQALFDWRIKREKFLQQLSAYAEFYTGILIAAPLFIIALFAVMNMIQPTIGGFDILFLTRASIYVIIPVVNISFLVFLRGVEVEI